MALYFLGTSDHASVDMSHFKPRDTIAVLGSGQLSWNENNRARLRFVVGAAMSELEQGSTNFATRTVQDGEHLFYCSTHPLLTWPGAADGVRQIFWHDDWPGSYKSINVNPRFWDVPLVSAAEAVHRGERLPEASVPLPDLSSAGTRTNCLLCHSMIDIRFSSGHGWYNGSDLVRAGTDEIIAHQTGSSPINGPGPYCGQCVEAALYGDGFVVPYGCQYIERHNRSLPIGLELPEHPSHWKWTDHPYAEECKRYGDEAFEWMLPEQSFATHRRIERAASLLEKF